MFFPSILYLQWNAMEPVGLVELPTPLCWIWRSAHILLELLREKFQYWFDDCKSAELPITIFSTLFGHALGHGQGGVQGGNRVEVFRISLWNQILKWNQQPPINQWPSESIELPGHLKISSIPLTSGPPSLDLEFFIPLFVVVNLR